MKAVIAGGGIGGLTTAIALEKLGHEVEVYEAAPEFKSVGAGLGLAANAVKAFDHLGLKDEVLAAGQLLPSAKLLTKKGAVITRVDSLKISAKYGVDNFAIHRADLHAVLLKNLKKTKLVTGKKAETCSEVASGVEVKFTDGTSASGDFLIAADGIHSQIRKQFLPKSAPRYAGYTCWRAVVPQPKQPIELPSETWGEGARFGIVPLKDDRIYWFACLNARQHDLSVRNFKKGNLLWHFDDFHAPVAELIQSAAQEDIIWGDIIDLAPIDKFAFGKVLLVGDAGHATTPNLGQGACQAIEDAAFLYSTLQGSGSIEEKFRRFETIRKPRTKKIVENSWRIGRVAQWEKPWAAGLRNKLFSMVPQSVQEKQLAFLYEVEFK